MVHKTAEASLDEGSLGAVVDLNTGNPLAYDPGLHAVVSAQARYNDLSDDLGPRLAGLASWTNLDQTFGVSASVAYSEYQTFELGNNSVRWAQGAFRSVDGTSCFAGSTYVPSAACNAVGLAFHPRIPRYGLVSHDRERLGATARSSGRQAIAPSCRSTGSTRTSRKPATSSGGKSSFVRTSARSTSPTTRSTATTISSRPRSTTPTSDERYSRESETKFWQVSAKLEQELTDDFAVTLRGGKSRSDADIPVETTILFDDRINGYTLTTPT